MPIEIPNEPMLSFLHGANKIALYGPVWILLTAIPFFLGLHNVVIMIFTFKIVAITFYIGLLWLIWRLSHKSIWALAFFGLNPLVTIETFVSAHNDVVMMFLGLLSFYLLQQRKLLTSVFFLVLSTLIKYATVFLIPVYGYVLFKTVKKKEIRWAKIWLWSALSMYIIFFLSPIREEIYAWYLIWPLSFVALFPPIHMLTFISIGFSFGLMFRIAPFIYTGSWAGATPFIKKIVTFIPPVLAGIFYVLKKKT